MSKGPSRRQWLLGLVGGVFGTTAAKALDHVLPGKPKEEPAAPASGRLSWTFRRADGTRGSGSTSVLGKVVIEPAATPGRFHLSHHDEQGRCCLTVDGVETVWVESAPAAYTGLHVGGDCLITHSYYTGGGEPISSVTYVYDSRGDRIDPPRQPGRSV